VAILYKDIRFSSRDARDPGNDGGQSMSMEISSSNREARYPDRAVIVNDDRATFHDTTARSVKIKKEGG
jgi:hypothetical protein